MRSYKKNYNTSSDNKYSESQNIKRTKLNAYPSMSKPHKEK